MGISFLFSKIIPLDLPLSRNLAVYISHGDKKFKETVSWSYLKENSHVICLNVLWSKNSIIVTICINLYICIYINYTGYYKNFKSNILYFESLKLNKASLSKSSLIYTLFSSKIHKSILSIFSVIIINIYIINIWCDH